MTRIICMRHSTCDSFASRVDHYGVALAYKMGELLSQTEKIDAIFSSPAPRAFQTAKIVAIALRYENDVLQCNELNENRCFPIFLMDLTEKANQNGWQNILVVTHQPNLEEELSRYFGENKSPFLDNCGYFILKADAKKRELEHHKDPSQAEISYDQFLELHDSLPDYLGDNIYEFLRQWKANH